MPLYSPASRRPEVRPVRSLCLGVTPGRRGLVGRRAPVPRGAAGPTDRAEPALVGGPGTRSVISLCNRYLSTTFLCRVMLWKYSAEVVYGPCDEFGVGRVVTHGSRVQILWRQPFDFGRYPDDRAFVKPVAERPAHFTRGSCDTYLKLAISGTFFFSRHNKGTLDRRLDIYSSHSARVNSGLCCLVCHLFCIRQ